MKPAENSIEPPGDGAEEGTAHIDEEVLAPAEVVNADHAWKALTLIVDWIKHAETKAGATLAASGVMGTALFNLVQNQTDPNWFLAAVAVLCSSSLLLAALFSALALRPRLQGKDEPTSSIYFHHIARRHERKAGAGSYVRAFGDLTSDAEKLVAEIATQVWANAHVARQKYKWGSLGVVSALTALPSLAFVAIAVGIR